MTNLDKMSSGLCFDLSSLPTKTPVSVLQELLSRRGTTPKYELVQVEGAIHEPTFRYRVTVADVVAMGTGRSKKEAKHAAAKAVLDRLITSHNHGPIPPGQSSLTDVKVNSIASQIVSPYDDKIPGNPIGTLQEMCMGRRWTPPTYELTCEKGLPHERQFTIACMAFNHMESGTGKSKKLAKRQAAYKMLQKLQDTPLEEPSISQGLDDEDEIAQHAINSSGYGDNRDKLSSITPSHCQKVSQFHNALRSSKGEKIEEIQRVSLSASDFDCISFLSEISDEQQFQVTYVDIEERSVSGKYQCLLQLSTLPVAVCFGTGVTVEEAHESAAKNALEYIRIMTKK
ncbi:interferon-inducible double-stranded RNA-dependent protein kinase activator A homolog [Ischnura elegans]|uniref:interferon-inducible double-stranded RNA-dependent protein kinase activator A homolog n=1 Tax=Ischnura elegans TaxID=197161 RepID=UPI001ED8AA87|nr:interferon-inducible double-stranded RNA-dependent protein kinase activator A homolog [Ischnura elegans]